MVLASICSEDGDNTCRVHWEFRYRNMGNY